jgi:hypothetical protein
VTNRKLAFCAIALAIGNASCASGNHATDPPHQPVGTLASRTTAPHIQRPSPTERPTLVPTPILRPTAPPAELALIARATASVEILNRHIARINKATEAGSPTKLSAAAKALQKWTRLELAWIKSNPAPECVADSRRPIATLSMHSTKLPL